MSSGLGISWTAFALSGSILTPLPVSMWPINDTSFPHSSFSLSLLRAMFCSRHLFSSASRFWFWSTFASSIVFPTPYTRICHRLCWGHSSNPLVLGWFFSEKFRMRLTIPRVIGTSRTFQMVLRMLWVYLYKAVYTTEKFGSGPVKKAVRTNKLMFAKKCWSFYRAIGAYGPVETPVFLYNSYGSVPLFWRVRTQIFLSCKRPLCVIIDHKI